MVLPVNGILNGVRNEDERRAQNDHYLMVKSFNPRTHLLIMTTHLGTDTQLKKAARIILIGSGVLLSAFTITLLSMGAGIFTYLILFSFFFMFSTFVDGVLVYSCRDIIECETGARLSTGETISFIKRDERSEKIFKYARTYNRWYNRGNLALALAALFLVAIGQLI